MKESTAGILPRHMSTQTAWQLLLESLLLTVRFNAAGKSTMLDVLSGRKHGKGVEGRVTLNGQPITPETSNKYISYVGQEDVFMPTLSAWESLLFCTQLCLPAMPVKQRNARMEAVLETMGLLRVKNSKVGVCP